jgi:hypothetical protein
MVLHNITVAGCVNNSPEITMNPESVPGEETQFPGLHAHLTLILASFSVEMLENQGLC